MELPMTWGTALLVGPYRYVGRFEDLIDDIGEVSLDRVQVHGVLQRATARADAAHQSISFTHRCQSCQLEAVPNGCSPSCSAVTPSSLLSFPSPVPRPA